MGHLPWVSLCVWAIRYVNFRTAFVNTSAAIMLTTMAARLARTKSGSFVLILPNLIHQRMAIMGRAKRRNHRPTMPTKPRNVVDPEFTIAAKMRKRFLGQPR
jgi:hypothetical protein